MTSTSSLIPALLALGLGGTALTLQLTGSGGTAAASGSDTDPALDVARRDTAERLRLLEEQVKSLRKASVLEPLDAGAGRQAAAVDEEALARAIEAYFEANPIDRMVEGAELETSAKELGSAAEIALMLGNLDSEEANQLWKRLVEEGRADEVLAHFKAMAEANPNDPEAQLALGQAYLGMTQQLEGMEAGKYATLADKALDQALELQPEHWEARFTKAVALSFWPPLFGKQPLAIRQFETLVDQQARGNPEPHHAQTHLLLGNLYVQTGDPARALEAWNAGLSLFPNDPGLLEQVEAASNGR